MGKHFEKDHWKPLLFCNGKYQVSRFGKVKSVYSLSKYGVVKMTGIIIKTYINSRGYEKVKLSWTERGKCMRKSMAIHRLVAMAFIPNPDNKHQVNHKDFNPLNNDFRNLEWVTAKENTVHFHTYGRKKHTPKANCAGKVESFPKYKSVMDTSTGIIYTTKDVSDLEGKPLKWLHRRLNGERPNDTIYKYI
jgi:hypothetical protein